MRCHFRYHIDVSCLLRGHHKKKREIFYLCGRVAHVCLEISGGMKFL